MHASTILQKILRTVTEQMDLRNARTLFLTLDALLRGRRLTLMELARHFPGAEYVRAPLKRLDRFLGNSAVYALRSQYYQVAAHWLLRGPCPVIVIDWSELKSDGRWHLLRAGVACRGRTITLYEEVHPDARKSNRQVEANFLKRLKSILPSGLRPILVTDAGFRSPWFKAVEKLDWHWVGRIRQNTTVRLDDGQLTAKSPWLPLKALCSKATSKALALGRAQLTQRTALTCQLTLIHQKSRGRHQTTRQGKRACNGHSEDLARSAKEPWLLASSCSLDFLSAAQIVSLYRKRMQIEQSFRDLKSHKYGSAFEDTLTRQPKRLEMLLLLQMLASLVAWLAGIKQSEAVQTVKQRAREERHYSIITRGWNLFRLHRSSMCRPDEQSVEKLRALIAQTA